MTSLELARLFHDTYERLAPMFGYETRPETREFDPESPNGQLMLAVVNEVRNHLTFADELAALTLRKIILKPGDQVSVTMPGTDGMDGEYVVGEDGVSLVRPAARTT